ncbi:MAG: hypothetical protein CME07_00920 [Gemmatimonadetes bacterium]|nr:hypothetical protein [Gemmatimonadota bacterium]
MKASDDCPSSPVRPSPRKPGWRPLMNILTAPRSRHALLGAALAATVLFLVAPSPAWSAWEWIGGGKIQAVKAMSPGTVVVAEDGGRVRLVEDYGVLSTPLQTGDGRNLHGMCVLGAQNAWVVGGMGGGCETQVPDDLVDGIILHTADGGAGWTELPNPNLPLERMQFEDVYFTDTMHGVVAGWQHGRVGGGAPRCDVFSINRISSIFVTFDGGATWQVAGRHEAPDSWYTAVDFRNATEGWASRTWTGLGNQDALYGTLDGGVTWTGVPTPVAEGLYDVKATGPLSCVAVGESGTILLTSDGGASWATPTTGVSSLLRGVDFSGTLGFAVGSGGTILRSTDYGVSWGTVASGIATGLRDVSVLSSTEVWAGGEHGALLYSTDGGDSWTVVSQPTTSSTFLDVAATGSGAFAVGYYETALRSDDLGDTWQSVSGFTGHLRTVEFPTATLGWAGGGISGVAHLFRTTDGGLNWDEPAVGDPRNLRDIGFRSPTQGWTVGHV